MGVVIDYSSGFFEASPSGETVGDVTGNATLDLSSGNVFNHTPTANTTFVFSNPPASGTAYGMTLKVTGADVPVGYDLANASYDSVAFNTSTQTANTTGVSFKPDGTKMFIVGAGNDTVYQYSLSTAWDISTASYDSVSFNITSQVASASSITFNTDGTIMYICDANLGGGIEQYTLSTAYDLSTAAYANKSYSPSDVYVLDMEINSDGTKMYVVGDQNDSVFQYTLSTAYDISTASYDSVLLDVDAAVSSGDIRGLAFNGDGTKLFVVSSGTDLIYQFGLSTAWDLSTASYDSVSFSVAGQDGVPGALFFKPDGTKMYLPGYINSSVFQYTTGSSAPATLAYPASVDWPSGTAPDAPAVGETDVLVFYTQDGGTTWYGFQAGDAMA